MALKSDIIYRCLILMITIGLVCGKGPCDIDVHTIDEVLRFKKSDCGFSGTWENELNSTIILFCNNGQLSGMYCSSVGNATDYYKLSGRYTMIGLNATVGWSVAWNNSRGNSQSTTSWTGLYYKATDTIQTQWILVSYTPINDFWRAFTTNQDQFKRVK